jgi:hypothetical protein
VVSLFADLTYEPARSLAGPYLAFLGSGATAVGLVAGLGELVGQGLRAVSGLVSDRTRRYWAVTIAGYTVSLLAVPALALAGRWQLAACLIVAERLGKAMRTPARDALLAHAAHRIGLGRAFALHEAVDQLGAVLGPILVAGVLAAKGSYAWAFGVLAFPAAVALLALTLARAAYPRPQDFESGEARGEPVPLPRAFWLYVTGMGLGSLTSPWSPSTSRDRVSRETPGSRCSTPERWAWMLWRRLAWAAGTTGGDCRWSWCRSFFPPAPRRSSSLHGWRW